MSSNKKLHNFEKSYKLEYVKVVQECLKVELLYSLEWSVSTVLVQPPLCDPLNYTLMFNLLFSLSYFVLFSYLHKLFGSS